MNLLPKNKSEFSQLDYWNTFFKHRGNKAFEWYGEYPQLCGFIHKYIKPKDNVLIVGCGNSKLSSDLYDVGYRNLINIDVSKVVIKQMKSLNISRPELIFEEMDALNMSYEDGKFTSILDKGTLDALMPDNEEETVNNICKYLNELDRVLKVGGRYVCISLLQDHVLSYLLVHFSEKGWMIRIHRCKDAEEQSRNEGATLVLPVFFIICTKLKNNSQLFAEMGFSNDGSVSKVDSLEKIRNSVKELQEVSMVYNGLKKSHASGQELLFDVLEENTSVKKYKVLVVDSVSISKSVKFAAFIVPQGRENEYIYSSVEGRQQLTKSLSMGRLALIFLSNDSELIPMDRVKADLSPLILNIAPSGCKQPIPFLSSSTEEDGTKEITRGTSKFSGEYIVSDVEKDGHILRKLVFLSSSNVTQSEARLKRVKSRKGKKLVVDVGYLSCRHHALMSVGASAVIEENSPVNILLIGLGGGSLCGYLHKCFDRANIVAVDIDPAMVKIATEYFNLSVDSRMDLQVADGIDYMKQLLSMDKHFDVILFDVDNKDVSMGMSCPPKEFIQPSVLSTVNSLLTNSGVFLMNLVCRNSKLRKDVHKQIKSEFVNSSRIKISDELGEILFCWKNNACNSTDMISKGANRLHSIIERNKFDKIDVITDELKKL